jgi:hypothetical protein
VLRLLAAVVVVALIPVAADPAAAASPPVLYTPPVAGEVIDPFRVPDRYGPGNRGTDYRTAVGAPVVAAADGEVWFAGPVAGALHVTVRHGDGLRTTASFLAAVAVGPGQRVAAGDLLGFSAGVLHVGVRDPDGVYLDPALLFAGTHVVTVRLVPGIEEGEAALRAERASLSGVVGDRLGAFLAYGADLTLTNAALIAHYGREMLPATHLARLAAAFERWRRASASCTPPDREPPSPSGRRIVVLVAGLGSSSDDATASVTELDTSGLGYAPGDVVRFSYAGGVVPGRAPSPDLAGLTVREYASADTQGDLHVAADRFEALLLDIRRRAPGVPVDVVAHSQGGIVARIGLTDLADDGRLPVEVDLFATLGTPHGGADAATAVQAAEASVAGPAALDRLRRATGLDLDPRLPSTGQLAETSATIAGLRARPVPEGLRSVSIGARTDLAVPLPRTVAPGMATVTVATGVTGTAHGDLPGRPEVTRELALARAGLGPTCTPLGRALSDAVVGDAIATATDLIGAGLLVAVP